ncbi:hypothetical protein LCGC14_2429130 [marine sediment metagenome]|uniref:Uncharacterized protein n=1 Tax=marine sediment metagenome TaxID=412755 RepID=A0A0F9EGF1_9ZZZZ
MTSKRKTFWCNIHTESMVMQIQEITGRTFGWTIRHLIKKGYDAMKSGKDMPAEYEDRIVKLNLAWQKIVDQRDKDLMQLTEKLNKIELSMERSAIR